MAKEAKAKTKSAFILAQGDTPAKQVVSLGKDAGFAFNERYVYTIRSVYRSRRERKALREQRSPDVGNSQATELLVAVAAEVGLGRAIEILNARRKAIVSALAR